MSSKDEEGEVNKPHSLNIGQLWQQKFRTSRNRPEIQDIQKWGKKFRTSSNWVVGSLTHEISA